MMLSNTETVQHPLSREDVLKFQGENKVSLQRRRQVGHHWSFVTLEFPNLGFVFCNAHYCLSRYHLTFTVSPCEDLDSGN